MTDTGDLREPDQIDGVPPPETRPHLLGHEAAMRRKFDDGKEVVDDVEAGGGGSRRRVNENDHDVNQ